MKSASKSSSKLEPPYIYPVPPDRLQIFTDYGLVEKKSTPAVEFLSYMLSKTALTTQKVTHSEIRDVGEKVYQQKVLRFTAEREKAVREAVRETERRAEEHLQRELARAAELAEADRRKVLADITEYYKEIAARVEKNRDKLEQERKEKLILRMIAEKEEMLEEQWQKAERLKEEAIKRVLTEQRKKLRAEAALQREKAIADSLRIAREKFKDRLQQEIQKVKKMCEKVAQEELRKIERLHKEEVTRLQERIVMVENHFEEQMEKMRRAQRDYWEMENEYCHFLDFTAENENLSGFLILPKKRQHGKGDSNRDQNVQTRLIALDQGTKSNQTDM